MPMNCPAKFKCTGPIPGALQSVNTQIFNEWLPGNQYYDISSGINIEWYTM
jgi:AraC family transcriptional regulator